MNRESLVLLARAAGFAVSAAVLTLVSGFASQAAAQDQPPADQNAAPPAEQQAPGEAPAAIPVQENAPAPAAKDDKGNKPEATELEKIEVTGSRIKRSDYEAESPVLVIKREDIEKTGLVSIGDILQSLPQAGAALNRANNNGGNGETNVDLRNLGSNRVLVLVNGRRWVGSTNTLNTGGVDLSTIPISVIDSIEVLKDGASAVYGSDAIAGVINIKTRRDFVGGELRSHVDTTQRGDGMQKLVSFAGGTVAGKTSVFVNAEFVDQSPLFSRSRPQSAVPVAGIPESDHSRGSLFIPNTRTLFIPNSNNASAINAAAGDPTITGPCYDITGAVGGLPGGVPIAGALDLCDITLDPATFTGPAGAHDFVRYDANRDAYNFAPVNYLITPNQRTSIFSQLSHQITDTIRMSGELLYTIRKSSQQLAQTPDGLGDLLGVHPFDWGYVAADNPYNPTNPQSPYYIPGTQAQDIGASTGGAGLVGTGAVLRRMVETGPRVFTQTASTYRLGGGLDGNFDFVARNFSWDAGSSYTQTDLKTVDDGLFNNERLARASGPLNDCVDVSDPNTGTISPAPPIAKGCVPFDWFGGTGSVTPAMIKYVAYTAIDTAKTSESTYYVNTSTEIPEISKFLAGPLGVAAGLEARHESFVGVPDPLKVMQVSSTNAQDATKGSYTANEMYTEVRIPALSNITWGMIPGLGNVGWLKDRSLVRELELSVAGRYSHYTGFGDNLSGKGGIRYKPYDDLILRSTYSSAFRAPAITELYLGDSVSFPSVTDPCVNTANPPADSRDANTQANCQADGADLTSQTLSQVPTVFGGNPKLKPEIAHTISAGFVYSPSYLPDFNMYVDYYKVYMKQFISVLGPDLTLDLCYRSDPSARVACENVQRGSDGQLQRIDNVFLNFAKVTVSGIDMNFDWILPLPQMLKPFGTVKWTYDGAYVMQFDTTQPTATGETTLGGLGQEFAGFGSIPRFKFNTGIKWALGNWEANWNVRYVHHLVEVCDDSTSGFGQGQGAPTGAILDNPTPVKSDAAYGLCTNPGQPIILQGVNHTEGYNVIKEAWFNDVQAIYSVPGWNTKVTFGIDNVFNQNPPRIVSAFADSYDKNTYGPVTWDSRTPYLAFQLNF